MKRFSREDFIERYGEDVVDGVNKRFGSLSKALKDETYGLRAYCIDRWSLFLLKEVIDALRMAFVSYHNPACLDEMREIFPEYFEVAEKKFEEISWLFTDINEYHTNQRGLPMYTIAGLTLAECLTKLRFIHSTYFEYGIINKKNAGKKDDHTEDMSTQNESDQTLDFNTYHAVCEILSYCERSVIDLMNRFR